MADGDEREADDLERYDGEGTEAGILPPFESSATGTYSPPPEEVTLAVDSARHDHTVDDVHLEDGDSGTAHEREVVERLGVSDEPVVHPPVVAATADMSADGTVPGASSDELDVAIESRSATVRPDAIGTRPIGTQRLGGGRGSPQQASARGESTSAGSATASVGHGASATGSSVSSGSADAIIGPPAPAIVVVVQQAKAAAESLSYRVLERLQDENSRLRRELEAAHVDRKLLEEQVRNLTRALRTPKRSVWRDVAAPILSILLSGSSVAIQAAEFVNSDDPGIEQVVVECTQVIQLFEAIPVEDIPNANELPGTS